MLFGSPLAALWNAADAKAPFLSVVFVNRSYSTGVNGLKLIYPEGMAVETNNYQGGVFDPPPDFAKMAEAANCYGETVSEPDEVGPALKRGLEQVHKGTPALIAAYLPTLVDEMTLPQP
jgi:acetolactate synthase I/II/III large subunit